MEVEDFGDNPEIRDIAYDSRQIKEESLFFAIRGLAADGNEFVAHAVENGAVAIVSEAGRIPGVSVPWVQVRNVRRVMAICSDHFFGRPSSTIRLAGVTGTNGKTTTAYLIHAACSSEAPTLLIGTIQTRIGESGVDSRLTTPESVDIQRLLGKASDHGCRYGAVEVSSHALVFHRVFACRFPVAVFTNLTQDHLDFHQTIENYFEAKSLLFDRSFNPALEHSVINGDDPFGCRLLSTAPGPVGYGLQSGNRIRPLKLESSIDGIRLQATFFEDERIEIESALVGSHNVFNIMAAAAAAYLLGVPKPGIQEGIGGLQAVPGRFEKVALDLPFSVVIDYAHTPDALENVLRLAREVTRGRVISVFGCGGDRDRSKRPQMGAISARLADLTIITSDNPRTEDPGRIVREIESGIHEKENRVISIVDRREAIARALSLARPKDLVLLAGKGHETYQEVGKQRFPFDERTIVKEAACSL